MVKNMVQNSSKWFKMVQCCSVLLLTILLTTCEVIPENERLIPIETESSNRTTLIVEFSGLKCNNCPLAAEEAHNLLSLYGNKLVVVEMHPASNKLTEAKPEYDYTCAASDLYYQHFGGDNTTPLPIGVVNMTKTDGDYFVKYQLWGSACIASSKITSPVTIAQAVDVSSNELHINATISNISTDMIDVQYIAWLTEDKIIGPQMMPEGTANPTYEHNHVLRDAITDEWGTALQINGKETETLSMTYTLPTHVNIENCNVVGIVMKDNVAIQVNEYKLKNIK